MSFDRNAWKRAWRKKPENRAKVRAYQSFYDKNRRVRTKEGRRAEGLRQKYGLTIGQVLEMAEAQGNECPLCKRHFPSENILARSTNQFVIDHDHATEQVRGLLCRACNALLGRFGDSVERIEEFLSRVRSYLGRA